MAAPEVFDRGAGQLRERKIAAKDGRARWTEPDGPRYAGLRQAIPRAVCSGRCLAGLRR